MPNNQPTILLVEDDQFLQQMYAGKLAREGMNVLAAADGEKALALLSAGGADVVLLDLLMPKKDGFATLAEIRAKKQWQKLPVIVLSNLGEEAEVKRARELGANEYLIKAQFLPSEVVAVVKKYLK